MKQGKWELMAGGVLLVAWFFMPLAGRLKGKTGEPAETEALAIFESLNRKLPKGSTIYYYDPEQRYEWIASIRLALAPRVFFPDTNRSADTLLIAIGAGLDTPALLQGNQTLWQAQGSKMAFWLVAKRR